MRKVQMTNLLMRCCLVGNEHMSTSVPVKTTCTDILETIFGTHHAVI
jgi:hypothetical protein